MPSMQQPPVSLQFGSDHVPFAEISPTVKLHVYEDDYLYPWEQSIPVILHHGFSRNGIFWTKWCTALTCVASASRL
jgi:hypothetical protein